MRHLCRKCGAPWSSTAARQPGFKETCTACTAFLHCCKNCRHHRPSAHNQCYIPTTDYVADRAGCNFCEDFEFADADAAPFEDARRAQARDALTGLFGAGETPAEDAARNTLLEDAPPKAGNPRDAFENLFGD